MFFEEALPAALTRRLGAHLLTEAMDVHPTIGCSAASPIATRSRGSRKC
jgi:hypothetical protein